MTISYNWLKDYLECDLSPEAIAEALTSIGLEVDSLEQVEEIPGGLAGVIVAEVIECVEHPDSDHLHITKLDGTAKGGVVVGIVDQFRVPIKFVGIGEGIDDLKVFNKREFVKSLFSKEDLE